MQRKAVRMLSGLGFREECRVAFSNLGILTVPSVYILENLLYVRKNHDVYVIHRSMHDYETRGRDALVPNYWRLGRYQYGPGYWANTFFN